MFTGIIQNCGIIQEREDRGGQVHFKIQIGESLKRPLELGESIAVDGVCLTVARRSGRVFEVDVVRATLEATTLGKLGPGSRVNLERALRYGDPLGGHFVSGHVDGRGKIVSIRRQGKNWLVTFRAPRPLMRFFAVKGSVVVDGISLTLQSCQGNTFAIALVPHTLKATTLGRKKAGDDVNLEVDLLARYLERLQKSGSEKSLRPGRVLIRSLRKQGF